MPENDAHIKGIVARAGRLALTLCVIGASVGLVMAGRSVLAIRDANATPPAAVAPRPVRVVRFAITDGYAVTRAFTGQIEPAQRAGLGFEFGGTVAAMLVDEGDAVAAGAPLARLDTRLLEAERERLTAARAATAAQAELAARTTERQTALQARGVASTQALDAASLSAAELAARMAEIDASLRAVAIRLDKATITAPFAGRVAARLADLGANAAPGQPVLTVVETTAPVFRVGVPPDALTALSRDGTAIIEIDGRPIAGRLRAILPDLDPATRTQMALYDLPDAALPAWRSVGTLRLDDRVATNGGWVPLSALDAGPRGLWRVLTVVRRDGDWIVGSEAVEIVHATAEQAFVRGTLADSALVIADGAHRVVPGERVSLAEPGA